MKRIVVEGEKSTSSLSSSIVVPSPASNAPSTTSVKSSGPNGSTAPPSLLGSEIDEVDDFVLLSDEESGEEDEADWSSEHSEA